MRDADIEIEIEEVEENVKQDKDNGTESHQNSNLKKILLKKR